MHPTRRGASAGFRRGEMATYRSSVAYGAVHAVVGMRRAQMTLTAIAGPPRVWRRRHRWGELVRRSRSVADLTTRVADGLMTAEAVLRALTSPRRVVAAWDCLLVAANTEALQMASHAAFPVDRRVHAVPCQADRVHKAEGHLHPWASGDSDAARTPGFDGEPEREDIQGRPDIGDPDISSCCRSERPEVQEADLGRLPPSEEGVRFG